MYETMVCNPHVTNPPIPLVPSSTHLLTTPAAIPQMFACIIGLVVGGKVRGDIFKVTVQLPRTLSKRSTSEYVYSTHHVFVVEEERTWYSRPDLKIPMFHLNDILLFHYLEVAYLKRIYSQLR